MKLRITQIMLSKGFGGAERLFVDLCLALAAQGMSVQAICHKKFGHKEELMAHAGIQINEVNVHGNWDIFAAQKIKKQIRNFQPQLIHSHLARSALYAGRAAHPLAIPLLANLHNYVNLKYYRRVDHFLPGTADQQHYLQQKEIAPKKITVIPHFSLVPAVAQTKPSNKAPIFISYGRFVPKKGFDVLLDALHQLNSLQEKDASPATLLLGGDGPCREALERQVIRLGLQDNVHFTGWVEDVAAFLDRGDIFVLPSRDEPFGIVMLEAMARGKAIISTKSKGPLEVLDEATAYMIAIDNSTELASAMKKMYHDATYRNSRAANALQHYKNNYSAEQVIPMFLSSYQQCCITPAER